MDSNTYSHIPIRRQLAARTNYRLIFIFSTILHYACAVVTTMFLVRFGYWQLLFVILLLASNPASGRAPVVHKSACSSPSDCRSTKCNGLFHSPAFSSCISFLQYACMTSTGIRRTETDKSQLHTTLSSCTYHVCCLTLTFFFLFYFVCLELHMGAVCSSEPAGEDEASEYKIPPDEH